MIEISLPTAAAIVLSHRWNRISVRRIRWRCAALGNFCFLITSAKLNRIKSFA